MCWIMTWLVVGGVVLCFVLSFAVVIWFWG